MTSLGAVRVHYVIDAAPELPADAPTAVLSNSLGATLAMWDKQIPELSQRFRVVRYDTRGHGGSPVPDGPYRIEDLADDVIALLDHLGLERVHFAGLSLGGMTGLCLAARNPDRIDRLVVLCTSAWLGPAHSWHARAAAVRSQGSSAVADAVVGRWYTDEFARTNPGHVAAARAMVAATPAKGYASCCEAIAAMDLTRDLALISALTLAIAGAADPATPPVLLARIAAGVADGRLLVVPDAAHLANDEQPAVITEALIDHLGAPVAGLAKAVQ